MLNQTILGKPRTQALRKCNEFDSCLCRHLPTDSNGDMKKPWWCDQGSQILLYGGIIGYTVLFIAYAGAHVASPKDPIFFYVFASKYVEGSIVLILCAAFEFICLLRLMTSGVLTMLTGMSYVICINSLLRLASHLLFLRNQLQFLLHLKDTIGIGTNMTNHFRIPEAERPTSATLIRRVKEFTMIRLVSNVGHSFWQYSTAMTFTPFLFFNLTSNMAAMVIAAPILAVYVYIFLPLQVLLSISTVMYFGHRLGSVREQSKEYIAEIRKALPKIRESDRRTVQYMKKLIRAQTPFGFKMGSFSFISAKTAESIVTESISYSLLIISLHNVA